MPKNSADPKKDRSDNRADKKENQQNDGTFPDESAMLKINKAADFVPSLNGVPKNKI